MIWGRLVPLGGISGFDVLLESDIFTLGHGSDFISGRNYPVNDIHCHIQKDSEGLAWIYDASENGTFLNSEKVGRDQCRRLHNGDIIGLVFIEDGHKDNVLLRFCLGDDDGSDQKVFCNSSAPKRSKDGCSSNRDTIRRKRCRTNDFNEEPHSSGHFDCTHTHPSSSKDIPSSHVIKASLGMKENNYPNSLSTSCLTTSLPSQQVAVSGSASALLENETSRNVNALSGIDEDLICVICQDIMHNCISLQPCMHSFCSGCYSSWMEESNQCPTCKQDVLRISKNYTLSKIVEQYIKAYPDRKRSEVDLKELDSKDKIKGDMLHPSACRGTFDNDSDTERTSADELGTNHCTSNERLSRTICRLCPDYVATETALCSAEPLHAPSFHPIFTSYVTSYLNSSILSREEFTRPCVPDQNHAICQCCLSPMPNLNNVRHDFVSAIPPHNCYICQRYFCHQLWPCPKLECHGCLFQLRYSKVDPDILNRRLLLDNSVETSVLLDYLQSQSIDMLTFLAMLMEYLDAGMFQSRDCGRTLMTGEMLSPSTFVCPSCSFSNLQDLALLYRERIKRDQLPAYIQKKPDCRWGTMCRTQRSNLSHATRYNHICVASRVL